MGYRTDNSMKTGISQSKVRVSASSFNVFMITHDILCIHFVSLFFTFYYYYYYYYNIVMMMMMMMMMMDDDNDDEVNEDEVG